MSFSKPEHITVRSIILIVDGWVLFSLFCCCGATKRKFRHNFTLDFADMDLLLLMLSFLVPKFPSKAELFLDYQTGGSLLFLAGSPEVVSWEEPPRLRLSASAISGRVAAENARMWDKRVRTKQICIKSGVFDFHRLTQRISGMSHEIGCLLTMNIKMFYFSLS